MANRAYKYRLYPSRIQAKQFAQTFGCVRFVYNQCLLEHERRYKVGENFATRLDMNNYCTRELKTQYPFLREVDKFSLTNAVYHLDEAYKRMFRHEGRRPKFKSEGLYVSSDGECADMPHFFRQSQKRLRKAQRKFRHKEKGSNNSSKQAKKIAKIYRHISNQRRDFLHKKSNSIAKRYDFVSVESLDMRALANKKFGNGKATLDNGYGMFLAMLKYKLTERGKVLLQVDKWYPSSQICCKCGAKNNLVKNLSVRKWNCPKCGAHHDRDHNAALNIKAEGIRLYTCG